MIAALYASRGTQSTNDFTRGGIKFGWGAIEDMLKREVERMQTNKLVRVPGLKENYVYRDPWTRLNVKPAKIMQVVAQILYCSTFAYAYYLWHMKGITLYVC